MRRLTAWLVLGLTVAAVASAPAVGRPTPRAAQITGSETVDDAAAATVVRLTLLPSFIALDRPMASQHLIVLGSRADGSQIDLTDQAIITSSAPAIVTVGSSQLWARADGTARITARAHGLTASVRATSRNARRPAVYSFKNDVVPVMARVGCSQGSCHGANSGKGGFKLSLRGYAPELDYPAMTRQLKGRRISLEAPELSLLLRKPALQVPHGGGQVLRRGSVAYNTLYGWLRQGAPGPAESDPALVSLSALPGERLYHPGEKQHCVIQARFSDGHTQDVTDRAVFLSNAPGVATASPEGLITATGPGTTAIMAKYMDRLASIPVTVPYSQTIDAAAFPRSTNYIDTAVYANLRRLNLEPSGPCSDADFQRRVYLDALGTLPTAEEARSFLASRDTDRRSRLIDSVLDRPEYASIWALKLCDLFMVRKEHMERKNTIALNEWLTEQFQQNRPWDQLVIDLVTAKGEVQDHPQTLWWASRQSIRPNAHGWVRSYELSGEIIAQVFLGQRIQCVRCHNHPTERYTQDDYYHFAAIFAQVNGDGPGDPIPSRFVATDPGEVRQPRTDMLMTPAALDGSRMAPAPGGDRREKFAEWLTGAGKMLFARSIANRVWARLFGMGIVEPVDDMRSTNPAKDERLLNQLACDLIIHHYDLKYLMGAIMRSRTYQTSSATIRKNRIDNQFFAHYPVRRLPAEEMMDAVAQVTGVPDRFATYPYGTRAIELSDPELNSFTLDTFGRPNRTTPCECDRGAGPTLSQALELFNGEALQQKLKNSSGVVTRLVKSSESDGDIVDIAFFRTLSRPPTSDEKASTLRLMAAASTKTEGVQDLFWALINTREFMFNH